MIKDFQLCGVGNDFTNRKIQSSIRQKIEASQ